MMGDAIDDAFDETEEESGEIMNQVMCSCVIALCRCSVLWT